MASLGFSPIADVMPYLRRFGAASHSFAALTSAMTTLGSKDFAVSYIDTGTAWVCAGPPLTSPSRRVEVATAFAEFAARRRRRAIFFAVDDDVALAPGLRHFGIGQAASCATATWDQIAARPSMRAQIRRARAKGVVVYAAQASADAPPDPQRLAQVARRWLANRPLAPMKFLLEVDLWRAPSERIWCLAERDGELVAAAVASPIYASNDVLLEHLLRSDAAPNGTTEALFAQLMRTCTERHIANVSLGLVPLHGDIPRWLAAAGALTRRLYDFRGLAAFKSRLRPTSWQPLYVAHNAPHDALAMHAVCAAFAGGSLTAFGWTSLKRRLARAPREAEPQA